MPDWWLAPEIGAWATVKRRRLYVKAGSVPDRLGDFPDLNWAAFSGERQQYLWRMAAFRGYPVFGLHSINYTRRKPCERKK
jgi:hypothetical protein